MQSEPSNLPLDFSWRDTYLLGYPPMDRMHREFVETVGALLQCADAEVVAALRRVDEHLETHFGEENRWMNEMDFPARDCHIDEHAAVRKSVQEVLALAEQGDFQHVRSLAIALADWFPGHADYLDSALSAWISKRVAGGKPVVVRRNVAVAADAPGSFNDRDVR